MGIARGIAAKPPTIPRRVVFSHSNRESFLTKLAIALTSVCAALTLAGSASGGLAVGVTEDAGKATIDAGAGFFATLNDVGMTQNQVSIPWNPSLPAAIASKGTLDAWRPVAQLRATGTL